MTKKEHSALLPHPNPGCLRAIAPAGLAAACVAAHKNGCSREDAASALADVLAISGPALDEAKKTGLLQERDGLFYAADHPGGQRMAGWAIVKRDYAFRALGVPADALKGSRGQKDLAGAALRQLFGLDNLPLLPSRAQARCELLRRIIASLGAPFPVPVQQPGRNFAFDPMSRSIYLAFAGLTAGTVLQADAALLSSALGGPAAAIAGLSATIIRAALQAGMPKAPEREEAFDLDGFAQAVRKIARRLETKPYAGRVAIAQVYDAGLAEGLELGSLDEFKLHLAEAAREGLLDLERYDIAGPFDANLKERSRLRFGRDERHFIVNQWI